VLAAYLVPPPKGQVAVGGFVLDPSGLLRGLPLAIVIDWGDGTRTFTTLFSTPSGFAFFLPQAYKRPKQHTRVMVHLEQFMPARLGFVDVLPPFAVPT
jgi:hypothetical protein